VASTYTLPASPTTLVAAPLAALFSPPLTLDRSPLARLLYLLLTLE
jgi:hypothetical protein